MMGRGPSGFMSETPAPFIASQWSATGWPTAALIPAFALNSVTSVGSRGGLTFATMANPESGQNGIYYYGPPGAN